MTLSEFKQKYTDDQTNLAKLFEQEWITGNSERPDNFPLELTYNEWLEQMQSFTELKHPSPF